MTKLGFRVNEEGKRQIIINVKSTEKEIKFSEINRKKESDHLDPKMLMVADGRYFSYELKQFKERFAI